MSVLQSMHQSCKPNADQESLDVLKARPGMDGFGIVPCHHTV